MDVQRPFCANFVTNFSLTFLITFMFELSFPIRSPKKKAWQLSFFCPRSYGFFWKMKKSRYNWEKAVNLTFFKECCSYVFHPLTAFIVFPWFKFIVWTIIPIFFPLLFLLDQSPQGQFLHLVHGQTNFFPMGDNSRKKIF